MTGRRWIPAAGAALVLVMLALVVVLVTRGADGVAGTLGEDDAGRRVEMAVGEQVVVELAGNPTTGFAWEVTQSDPAVIVPFGDPDYESESDDDGSGGTFTFRFTAVGPGAAEVLLTYRQTWGDAPPAGTFLFRVEVG